MSQKFLKVMQAGWKQDMAAGFITDHSDEDDDDPEYSGESNSINGEPNIKSKNYLTDRAIYI